MSQRRKIETNDTNELCLGLRIASDDPRSMCGVLRSELKMLIRRDEKMKKGWLISVSG